MKQLGELLKNTLTTGLLVLFPLFACVYVLVKVAGFLTDFIKPLLLNFLPQTRFVGVALADITSIVILLLLCFVVGLIARTAIGGAFVLRLRRVLTAILPGYKIFLSISRIVFDREDASGTAVIVDRGESRQIGFMMEQTSPEELTIYFPDAPGLFSGTVELVKSSAVERLNIPAGQAARVITTFGRGTRKLLKDRDTHQS